MELKRDCLKSTGSSRTSGVTDFAGILIFETVSFFDILLSLYPDNPSDMIIKANNFGISNV